MEPDLDPIVVAALGELAAAAPPDDLRDAVLAAARPLYAT